MDKPNFIPWEKVRAELLQNPKVKKLYEERAVERELMLELIQARKEGRITQKELAKRMGTKQSAISRFESGRTNPTVAFLYKLADALGVEIEFKMKRRSS